mgnify:CR=1 FL=1|jgi:chemotaxis protein MotB|tara:strand:+ start:1126 stop:2151 length:1026 start_codon:yes stop_codon:yes gene_type:complete
MISLVRKQRESINIWAGFVDALSALLVVIIFLLMVFVISQFFLRETLMSRDKALDTLNMQIQKLSEVLALEKKMTGELKDDISRLTVQLESSLAKSMGLEERLKEQQTIAKENMGQLLLREEELEQERELTIKQRDELALLNQQIYALREQLSIIASELELTKEREKAAKIKVDELGKKLNIAMASKLQELANYRSEFFGRLKKVLGDRADIKIIGDRFVFQSEVLFDTASSEIQEDGKSQLQKVAQTLQEISTEFPTDLEWILRIDGHTDERPIQSERFASNWELSSARAISVVKFFLSQGIDPKRLAAAGFGSTHPITEKKTEKAYRQNRRIEIKLTQH